MADVSIGVVTSAPAHHCVFVLPFASRRGTLEVPVASHLGLPGNSWELPSGPIVLGSAGCAIDSGPRSLCLLGIAVLARGGSCCLALPRALVAFLRSLGGAGVVIISSSSGPIVLGSAGCAIDSGPRSLCLLGIAVLARGGSC